MSDNIDGEGAISVVEEVQEEGTPQKDEMDALQKEKAALEDDEIIPEVVETAAETTSIGTLLQEVAKETFETTRKFLVEASTAKKEQLASVVNQEELGRHEVVEEEGKEAVDESGQDQQGTEINFEDFSVMSIEQLDSYLHENDEENYEEEEGEEEEEEGDEEEGESEGPSTHEEASAGSEQDRVPAEYLSADNPLMTKFQAILKTHLLGEIAKLREDTGELEDRYGRDLHAFREAGEQMERIVAQKIASDKRIGELREKLETSKGERDKIGKDHEKWKKTSEEENEKMVHVEKNYQELMLRTENLSRTAQQLEALELKRQSELSIARIQSAKSTKEIENLLSNDLKQDVLSLMINREINKLERSLAEAEAQYGAKTVEMGSKLSRLADARADLASMERENKKINEGWTQVVTAIQTKQKEYLDAQDEARAAQQKLRELQISTVNTRKAWTVEKYNGEKITAELNRYVAEVNNLNRKINRKETLKSNLQRQLMTLSKIVARNESHITEFSRLQAQLTKELLSLTGACDSITTTIRNGENTILEKYQTNFVVNSKEMTAVSEDIRCFKLQNEELEAELSSYDHKLSTIRLELDTLRGQKRQELAVLNSVKKDVAAKLRQIEHIERNIANIKSKTDVIANKIQHETQVLENMKKDSEENSKSPTEKAIEKVTQETEKLCSNLKELKTQWLRRQSTLIDLMEEHNKNLKAINELEWQNHEYGYKLNTRVSAVEEKMAQHDKLLNSVERLKKRIDRDFEKTLQGKDAEAELHQKYDVKQDKFYNELQTAEKELYLLKQSIQNLETEERSYLREIERAEGLYLSWDKKCTLASKEKEKYEMEKKPGGEIEQLKKEIHRMQMRHTQLKNVQKKLMSDLEACVTRREKIMDNVRAREKRNSKEDTKRYIHVKKVQQLRTQIKQVQVEIKTLEKLSDEYKAKKEDLINENTNKQNQLKSLQENIEKVERQLQEGYLHKQKNLEILIRKQRRCRHYCQLKDGKYRPLFRTEASLELESMKQSDTNQSLVSLLGTLLGDFPSLQYSFRKILNTLKLH